MKIIIAPTKTMDIKKSKFLVDTTPLFEKDAKKIMSKLKKKTKKALSDIYNIKSKVLDKTYDYIQKDYESGHAIMSYTGLAYKNLDIGSLSKQDFDYLNNYVYILDSLYGLLRPSDLITYYRLDFNTELDINLYSYWDKVCNYIQDDVIVNLASKEYSKMIKKDMINIHFKEEQNNKFINKATYSKQARGTMLNFIVKNRIKNPINIKNFNELGYIFNDKLSNETNYVFTRKA